MKITIDTNILISGSFWRGASDRILEKVENKEIELILSKEIIEEFSRVLNYDEIQQKIRDKNLEMKRAVEKIVSISSLSAMFKFTSNKFILIYKINLIYKLFGGKC